MKWSSGASTPSLFQGLHVLVDDDPRWIWNPLQQTQAACLGGASVVQLRSKHLTDQEIVSLGLKIRESTRNAGIQFVVNDRFDLAMACEADGVHLGQTDFPPDALPESIRQNLRVGRSTHSLDQAHIAMEEGADYIAFGPIFETKSKDSEYEQRGLLQLREIAERLLPHPVVAIGGITRDNLAEILAAGARGAAVIGAVAQAKNPRQAVGELTAIFDSVSETQ